jgi:hypothetical protein
MHSSNIVIVIVEYYERIQFFFVFVCMIGAFEYD